MNTIPKTIVKTNAEIRTILKACFPDNPNIEYDGRYAREIHVALTELLNLVRVSLPLQGLTFGLKLSPLEDCIVRSSMYTQEKTVEATDITGPLLEFVYEMKVTACNGYPWNGKVKECWLTVI
jgi:hypothetical protein